MFCDKGFYMREQLKNTFFLLNKNLWLVFLLATFALGGLLYLSILKSFADSIIEIFVGALTFLLLVVTGFAGFYYTVRTMVLTSEREVSCSLIKAFPKGVAEYFSSAFGFVCLYMFLFLFFIIAFIFIGKSLIPPFSFNAEDLANLMATGGTILDFEKLLTPEDMISMRWWKVLHFVCTTLLWFLSLYWIPETFLNTKNAFKSLIFSIKMIFKNLSVTLNLFVVILLINFVIQNLLMLLPANEFLGMLGLFIHFYVLTFTCVLVFDCYKNFFDLPVVSVVAE